MSLSYDSWIRKEESLRRAYDTLYKQKQDALLLKKKSHTRWPLKTYNRKTHAIKERQVYTSVDKHYPSKPHINQIPSYSYRPLDPQLTKTSSRYGSCSTTAPDYHDSVFHDVQDYVENALKDQKKDDLLTQHENKVDLIKDLSIHLMDQLLHQIMNTGQETDKPLDWEFIMANLIQLKALPVPIIDRIQRQMELKTGKKTPGKV
ncbi:hypothetical protein EDC96DRAFT_510604 [Choanephora cucurbitarum]|nr:hypothetical protein EDC96DRAFT_510604 [Choanephora cucurbitarum]